MTEKEVLICLAVTFSQMLLYILFCSKKEKILNFNKNSVCGTNENIDLKSENLEEDSDSSIAENNSAYKSRQSWLLVCSAFAIFLLTNIFLVRNVNGWNNFFKVSMLTIIIAAAATVDLKTKRIPNDLILLGLSFRLVIYIFEIFNCREDILSIFKNDIIGFAIGFGSLFLAAVISKGSVGFGDVKLFAVIGVCGGAILTYSTLLIALIVNTVCSLVIMLIKKKNRKASVPFGPAILIGYLTALCLSSF